MSFLSKIFRLNRKNEFTHSYSLSHYFPKDTVYFYGFPSGEDSHFYNAVPPWVEELVSMRPMVCAGKHVKVSSFASGAKSEIRTLLKEMGTPFLEEKSHISLPGHITTQLQGKERNKHIKEALKRIVTKGNLVMAQPFLDKKINSIYQISPQITIDLNDKMNRPDYIPAQYIPEVYRKFSNGKNFYEYNWSEKFPTVVKVCSSSAGDGVRICYTISDVEKAKEDFKNIEGTIFLEEFIHSVYNLGVQFGVPHDSSQDIDIIGHNEQRTGSNGEYLGGMINPHHQIPNISEIYRVIKEEILPNVRAKGWYGVGGLDVLIDKDGKFFFIDTNFRMTAAFAFVYLIQNKILQRPLVSFMGSFVGDEEKFRKTILPICKNGTKGQKMTIIALTETEGTYRFQGGMFFDKESDIPKNAQELLNLGIKSHTLEGLVK